MTRLVSAKREIWVDNVKVFACILVAMGHFFQSMTKANIVPTNTVYQWFDETIYLFHVQLFFICSGYLYQKYSRVDTFVSWRNNIVKKALALGVPYFTFSLVTWVLKTVFSSSVNEQSNGLFQTLFLKPASPYWYLYCLFLIFMITPTFKNKKSACCGLLIALGFKVISIIGWSSAYALSITLANEVWFVIGMCLCVVDVERFFNMKKCCYLGIAAMIVFTIGSVVYWQGTRGILSFVLGLLACVAVVFLFGYFCKRDARRVWPVAKYTMPIFLMHTIFAAALRSILLKIGITNAVLHVILGLAISFLGPIITAKVMHYFKWMEFFVYPIKLIEVRNTNKGT